jgi:16S rRNA (guanine527-N7)-methyltransferase
VPPGSGTGDEGTGASQDAACLFAQRGSGTQSQPGHSSADAARLIFGRSLAEAERYAELLAGPGVERGLIGPDETSRIWERHLLNCAVVAELIPDRGLVADLGSGAGLPGVVLAMLRPKAEVILVEPMERRTVFLTECVRELGLTNARVQRGRAEDLTGKINADVVTARAVARLERLAVLAAGLARPGGQILAIKGSSAARELSDAETVLRRLGASEAEIVTVGSEFLAQPTTVIRFLTRTASGKAGGAGRRPSRRG